MGAANKSLKLTADWQPLSASPSRQSHLTLALWMDHHAAVLAHPGAPAYRSGYRLSTRAAARAFGNNTDEEIMYTTRRPNRSECFVSRYGPQGPLSSPLS
jgi:hypothetical protein